MDFVVESSEYNTVMTMVDSISKRAHFIPTHMTITAESTVRLFLYYIWKPHSLPNYVVLDRDL